MIKTNFFYSIIFIIILNSCGPSRKARDVKSNALFNSWINHSKSQLIETWGQPDSIFINPKGEILLYKERTDYKSVMNGNYTGIQYSYKKEMYVNADSVIYYWKAWRRK